MIKTVLHALWFLLLLPAAAGAQETGAGRLARLQADLKGPSSATQVLTRWCDDLHLAAPAVIHAENATPSDTAVAADIRTLLQVGGDEPLRHRHVRLTCGGHVLSEADNWYVPARLTPEMNASLDGSDTPFGTVVRPLNFHRNTIAVVPQSGATVLQVKALLLTPEEKPISLVVENYSAELTGMP